MSDRALVLGILPINLVATVTITAAGTTIYPVTPAVYPAVVGSVNGLAGMNSLSAQAKFVYGSGGTSADVYIQTSLDKGVSWFDVINFHFLVATASKLSTVNMFPSTPFVAGTAPGDGTLAANTVLSGLLGDRVRAKVVTVGTYAGGTTLTVDIVAKG